MNKNKFALFVLLELPIFLIVLYICWFIVFVKSQGDLTPLPFVLAIILSSFGFGILFLFYNDKLAPMINKSSWGLYKFTPVGIIKLGYILLLIGFMWFIFLIYHNQGIINLLNIIAANLK